MFGQLLGCYWRKLMVFGLLIVCVSSVLVVPATPAQAQSLRETICFLPSAPRPGTNFPCTVRIVNNTGEHIQVTVEYIRQPRFSSRIHEEYTTVLAPGEHLEYDRVMQIPHVTVYQAAQVGGVWIPLQNTGQITHPLTTLDDDYVYPRNPTFVISITRRLSGVGYDFAVYHRTI